jgi:hypothetical protein
VEHETPGPEEPDDCVEPPVASPEVDSTENGAVDHGMSSWLTGLDIFKFNYLSNLIICKFNYLSFTLEIIHTKRLLLSTTFKYNVAHFAD